MEHELSQAEEKKLQIVKEDECPFNKILSRSSSMGYSSRVYYYRKPEGIPFKWEMQPGTPKNPQLHESIPPLSPPPAILSLGLPKPCMEQPKSQSWPRFIIRFWRKRKEGKGRRRENHWTEDKLRTERYGVFCGSDCEFMESPNNSRYSSSSSLSFSNDLDTPNSVQSSRVQCSGRGSLARRFGCSPWNINSLVVCISRRV